MATIDNVRLTITDSNGKPGYSRIAYSYELHPSELDCVEQREYTVKTDLWGEDLVDDDVLAWGQDEHKVKFDRARPGEPITVERVFEIETKVLDEDVFGDDEVYAMVEASSGLGSDAGGEDPVMGRSNTVIGYF